MIFRTRLLSSLKGVKEKRFFAAGTHTHATTKKPALVVGLGLAALVSGFALFYSSERTNELSTVGFTECQVKEIKPVTKDTSIYSIHAELKSKELPMPYHVVVKDDACQVARSYTPITYDGKIMELLVKRYPRGCLSNLFGLLDVGDTVWLRGPLPSLPPSAKLEERKKIGMVAAGTGITPMWQMIESKLEADIGCEINLVYCSLSPENILMKKELDAVQSKYADRFTVTYFVDTAETTFQQLHTKVGYLHDSFLRDAMPSGPEATIFVCGPDGFVRWVSGATDNGSGVGGMLGRLGYRRDQVFRL